MVRVNDVDKDICDHELEIYFSSYDNIYINSYGVCLFVFLLLFLARLS